MENAQPVANSEVEDKQVTTENANTKAEETKPSGEKEEEKDVPYFRNMVTSETNRLTSLCDKWQDIMNESSLTEEGEWNLLYLGRELHMLCAVLNSLVLCAVLKKCAILKQVSD